MKLKQAETSYNRIELDVRKWIKNKGTVQVKLDELEQNLKRITGDANLRMLIERIVIYEVKEGLHLEIELNANFKNHRNYYDENGVIILDSNSENRPTICNNYKLRKQGRKTAVVSRP